MAVITRKPTGTPAWDLMLVAGGPKAGKSYACAEASASAFIHRTFWLSWGEADPDEYGALPGADFEIVEYPKNYAGLMASIRECIAEPAPEGMKNLIVLDKASKVWDTISDQADYAARVRAAKKQKLDYVPAPEAVGDEVSIGNDLWNSATNRWLDMLDLLKTHDGPVILTANLKEVTVMKNGLPTKDKQWKIEGQKNFAADVSCVVEIPVLREVYITGVRSLRFEPVKTGEHNNDTRYHDFTIEKLWATLGLTADSVKSTHATIQRPGAAPDGVQQERAATPTSDEFKQHVQKAISQGGSDPVATLGALWNQMGEPFLNGLMLETKEGDSITAAAWMTRLRDHFLAQSNQQGTPAAPQEPARPAQPAPAYTGALGAIHSELVGQADALGIPYQLHIAGLMETKEGANDLNSFPPVGVLAWAVAQRPQVVVALRAAGRATEAESYEKAPKGRPLNWNQLTGAHDATRENAQQEQDA